MVCLLLGLVRIAAASDAAPLALAHEKELAVPATYASYWIETEDIAKASVPDNLQLHWTPVDFATINAGPISEPVWFRIPMHNSTADPLSRILEIRWLNIKSVDLYIQRQQSTEHYFAGITDDGEIVEPGGSSYTFPLQLETNETVELFIRIQTGYFTFLPLYVWDEPSFEARQIQMHNWYFLGFGALVALLFYNLSLCVFVRDRAYFYYCTYVTSIIFYELAFNGMGNAYLWGSNLWMHEHAMGLGVHLSFLSGCFFIREFLSVGSYSIWLQRIIDAGIAYWAIALLALLVLDDFFQSSIYMSIVCCMFALFTSVYLWRLGNRLAKYYFVAWSSLLFFTMLMLCMMIGVLPHFPLAEHGQMIGFVTEMVMLSFALAARINLERNQREQAQKKAFHLQLDINQERENTITAQQTILELEKQNNVLLEKRVAERTEELKKTLDRLSDANGELSRLSLTDSLTGVANRRHFDEVLDNEMKRSRRNQQPLSLILIDIDHFKQLNDHYGHVAGDECLRLFARLLAATITRTSDLVARYGGEEFAVVLPETNQQAAYAVAEKIRHEIEQTEFTHGQQRILMTASIGVVGYSDHEYKTVAELIAAADQALYAAKDNGRNRCVLADLAS